MKQQTHDLSYFLGKTFFGDDGLQPILDTLELKKDKVTAYVPRWK